ncbi:MAG: hypothetical protein K6V97_11325 [Actinomycetia bacterium]|nr:hypothetical protein [Actinomycetes bacterium]
MTTMFKRGLRHDPLCPCGHRVSLALVSLPWDPTADAATLTDWWTAALTAHYREHPGTRPPSPDAIRAEAADLVRDTLTVRLMMDHAPDCPCGDPSPRYCLRLEQDPAADGATLTERWAVALVDYYQIHRVPSAFPQLFDRFGPRIPRPGRFAAPARARRFRAEEPLPRGRIRHGAPPPDVLRGKAAALVRLMARPVTDPSQHEDSP